MTTPLINQLGVVKRNITRADRAAVEHLGSFGSATVHEAMGRVGLMKPYMRPIYSGAQVAGTIGGRGLLDADTSDDLIVDVPDESETGAGGGELSAAVTALPADVQMIGYRVMWALAGIVALSASAISYFLRDPEGETEAEAHPAPAPATGAPPRRQPAGAPARP